MATRTVSRRTPIGSITSKFVQFLAVDLEAKDLAKRADALKSELKDFAEANGEADENGHKIYALEAPVEVKGKHFAGFMRQRRVSQVFDEEAAEALCTERGFQREEFISVQEYVDQDKIARLYAEDRISDKEFKSLVKERETFAFVPVKGD